MEIRVREIKEATRRKCGSVPYDMNDRTPYPTFVKKTKAPVIKQGRQMTIDEQAEFLSLKVQLTRRYAVRAISRGRVHAKHLVQTPEALKGLAAFLSTWLIPVKNARPSVEAVAKAG